MRDGALEVRVGEQIENLEEDIRGTDGRAFFAGTYVTRGLEELVRKAVARLAGQSSCAGVVLKQALGGRQDAFDEMRGSSGGGSGVEAGGDAGRAAYQ